MERPALRRFPAFGLRLADVVEQCRPSKPKRGGLAVGAGLVAVAHVVEHLQRVVKIVLVTFAVLCLNHVERGEFGQDELQQAATVQVHEATAGLRGHHYLVELLRYALAAYYPYAVGVALQGVECLLVDIEAELRGEPHAAHHAQWVVGEGDIGVERRADDAVLHVENTVEGVHDFAKALLVETHGEGVDGEVAAILVVFQGAVFHMWLARVVAVALLARAHELHLVATPFHLCRAEILEHGEVGVPREQFPESLGNLYAAAHDHDIDVVARALEEKVTHVSANHVGLKAEAVGGLRDFVKYVFVQQLCHVGIAQHSHNSIAFSNSLQKYE